MSARRGSATRNCSSSNDVLDDERTAAKPLFVAWKALLSADGGGVGDDSTEGAPMLSLSELNLMLPVDWLVSRMRFRSGLKATGEEVVAAMAEVSLSPVSPEKVDTYEYHRLYTALPVRGRTAGITFGRRV